jgi:gliding motility-associated-like protein
VLLRLIANICVFILIIPLPTHVIGQGLGRAIINVTFGEGRTNPGPPLPADNTGMTYSDDSCASPAPSYTITNNLYRCPATRMGRSQDNTYDDYGYMMLVNDISSSDNKILFIDTLKEALCPGTSYRFSVLYLNTMIPGGCNSFVHLPRLILSIETATGQAIQSVNTGPIAYDFSPPGGFVPKFHLFSVAFDPPPGIDVFVLKILDDPSQYSRCGYSFALDDIQFAALGPEARITFSDAIGTVLVRSVCYQNNEIVSVNGAVDSFYPNTRLQWQESADSGTTWTDIPGATSDRYSKLCSTPGTFLVRLSAGDAPNVSNPNCRVVSNVLKIQVEGPPTGYTVTSNSPVCAGSALQFNATGGASYEWRGPNGFYDNVYYAGIYHPSLTDSGTYYVDIVSLGGCRTTDSVHVTILGTTHPDAFPDTSVCVGKPVRLGVSQRVSYLWSPSDGLSNITVGNPVAKPNATTVYTVKVTDSSGCTDTAHVQIRILNNIELKAATTGPEIFCRPSDSASFKDVSTGVITKWSWNFGNGQTDTTNDPPIQYFSIPANEDDYIVRLAIADTSGCTDTAYHFIKVVANCRIALPTAFTPNGDGLNDYLYPLNAYKATNLVFRVYNRAGQVVFETKDWSRKWDGTFHGTPQGTGVYVWTLEYNDASNKKISLKGTSALIR